MNDAGGVALKIASRMGPSSGESARMNSNNYWILANPDNVKMHEPLP